MKKTLFFSLLIQTLYLPILLSQAFDSEANVSQIQIESGVLNEQRELTIKLPGAYVTSGIDYPVLYLLDGRTHFQHASAAADFLSRYGLMPEIIIVSIHNVDRNRDFSPVHVERIPSSGGADKFLGFLSEELIPYIDDHYRSSGFNMLFGHSFGGTFAVHSLLEKPALFDAYIAASPALQYADNYLVKRAEANFTAPSEPKHFYMTVGNEPNYFEALSGYNAVLEKCKDKFHSAYIRHPGENHNTIPYVSLFGGLKFIFSDWQLPQEVLSGGLEEIDAYYENLSEKYGSRIRASEQLLNILGYGYLRDGENKQAILVFKENVKRYPESANVYDSMGEALERSGDIEKARQYYQEAYDIGKKTNDPNVLIFRQNLNRVMEK